jgi:hypothetical protein
MAFNQDTARALYRKLLGLYPRAFRERVGESMEQTFNDLCNERKQSAERGIFGFVLKIFVETAIGVIHENILVIKDMSTMRNILTNLRLPAIIGSLAVLPFVLLEFIFVISNGQNTFSIRNAVDLVVVFAFLWLGITAIVLILLPIVRNMRTGKSLIASPEATQESPPRNVLSSNSEAIIGFLLALPFVTIVSLLWLNIEPPLGPLEPFLENRDPDQPDVLGALIILCAFLFAVLACIIARAPIVRTMRAGGSLLAHPPNLILAVTILSFIATMVIGVIVDQFPCWMGVPNCD